MDKMYLMDAKNVLTLCEEMGRFVLVMETVRPIFNSTDSQTEVNKAFKLLWSEFNNLNKANCQVLFHLLDAGLPEVKESLKSLEEMGIDIEELRKNAFSN